MIYSKIIRTGASLITINPQNSQTTLTPEQQKADDQRASFVKVVLADTEDIWTCLQV
jgi:uncharacterized protein